MSNKTALITGAAGFVGSFLAEELVARGWTVVGTAMADESLANLGAIKSKIKIRKLDILDSKRCARLVKEINPTHLFHLAAFSSVGQSFSNGRLTYKINFDGTLNILEACLSAQNLKKIVYVSSADCYGTFSPPNKTLKESQPFNPISPYAISKVAAENLCMLFYRQHKLPVTIARSFNHAGPRQTGNFVIPSFSKQIARIEAGIQSPVMNIGELSARRDLSDVRDIVRGYRLLAQKGKAGQAYHFCSGKAVSIEFVLRQLLSLSDAKIKVHRDKSKVRKNDIPVLRGSNLKAVQELGYHSRYNLKVTLKETLDYWRTVVNKQK